jgi:deoxyadenosine/deoxycytidine kinase
VLEDTENPFLADFYNDRPGAALQAQLFYLLNRHRQLTALRQATSSAGHGLRLPVRRDKIFAYLNLDDNELFIYQRLYDLLARTCRRPTWSSTCRRRPTCCSTPARPRAGGSRERPAAAGATTCAS